MVKLERCWPWRERRGLQSTAKCSSAAPEACAVGGDRNAGQSFHDACLLGWESPAPEQLNQGATNLHRDERYLNASNEADDPVLYRPGRCKACLRGQRRRASARDVRHVAYPSRVSVAELGLAALAGGLFS